MVGSNLIPTSLRSQVQKGGGTIQNPYQPLNSNMQSLSVHTLEQAARTLEKFLQNDSSFPLLVDQLKLGGQDTATVSGLADTDYPSLAGASLSSLSILSQLKRVPLPAELLEQFAHIQCNCMMGLFPEIGRAWLAIDSNIFIWTYEDGGDLAYFDGLTETILSVKLIKPKPGIFQSHIYNLLCLTTPVEIVLLGVSFTKPQEGCGVLSNEMHLLPEPLFSIPTDNVYVLQIASLDNGRIFMAGKDGCLYELAYQAEDGWFSRKCRKINLSTSALSFLVPTFLNFTLSQEDPVVQITVDNSRNILYTRSEKGTIQMYDLGEDGQGFSSITALSQRTIIQQASFVARTIDPSNFSPIVHIAAIEQSESAYIHLIAVTHAGVRLYFTTTSFNLPQSRPSMLQLLHVRLPPGFSASSPAQRPTKIHTAYYKQGMLVLLSGQSEDNDFLWSINSDCFSFHSNLMETQVTVDVGGKVWAMSEVSLPPRRQLSRALTGVQDPPQVVTQHMEDPRKFVMLSAQGTHIFTKLRPVDQLRRLLEENHGPDNETVKSFISLYTEDQACATCLILACSTAPQDQQVAEWATRAFFLYGGELPIPGALSHDSQISSSAWTPAFPLNRTSATGFNPVQVSTPYTDLRGAPVASSPSMLGSPYILNQPQQTIGSVGTRQHLGSEFTTSSKHNGLYIYLARIMRPLWNSRVVSEVPHHPSSGSSLTSSVTSDELGWYLELLEGLQKFMEANSSVTSQHLAQGIGLVAHGDSTQYLQRTAHSDQQVMEKTSLVHLLQFIVVTKETLSLLKILCDHQFHVIAGMLTKDQQNQLRAMTFRDMFVCGNEMATVLITCLINRYLGDNATTDAISTRLREMCSSLYTTEDAVCSKVNEILASAKQNHSKMDKDRMLKDALQLCKQVTAKLNLPVIASHFQSVHFYDGVVDLCLATASQRDPQNKALHYYHNGEPVDDYEGLQAYCSRMDCYKVMMDTLAHLLLASHSHPQAPSVPKFPGPPPASNPNSISPQEAKEQCENMYSMALQSSDELLHVALYTWLIDRQQTEKMLSFKTPFLEDFLKRLSATQTDSQATLDLLWMYYEKIGNFSASARILAKLADRHSVNLSLSDRVDLLSRAILCVQSTNTRPSGRNEGEFLHQLEEKMEVARLQSQLLDAVRQIDPRTVVVQDAITRLNSDLLDVTSLYEQFAEPFRLPECQLAIIHCAGHHDKGLVESLWENIVNKDLHLHSGSAPNTVVANLSNKIKYLGRLYGSSQQYFPLEFLIKLLEVKSCTLNLDNKWVFSTLHTVGVSLSAILTIYDKLYRSRDNCWTALKKPLHLVTVLSSLITWFADTPLIVLPHERRSSVTQCLDCVSGYLVDLQAVGLSDPAVQNLVGRFRSAQAKLERIS